MKSVPFTISYTEVCLNDSNKQKACLFLQIFKNGTSTTPCHSPGCPPEVLSAIHSQPSLLSLPPGQEETIQHATLSGLQQFQFRLLPFPG